MKKLLVLLTLSLFSISLAGCAPVDTIKEKFEDFRNDDPYNFDDIDTTEDPIEVVEVFETETSTKNFDISLNSSLTPCATKDQEELAGEYTVDLEDRQLFLHIGYEFREATIQYDLNGYDTMSKIGQFRYITNNDSDILYYENNNKLYTKISITPIKTKEFDNNNVSIGGIVPLELYENDDFVNAILPNISKKSGSSIVTDDDYVVVIKPDEYSEVNFTDGEIKIIYKLIYDETIATNLIEQLNKVGVYNIKSAKLLPSDVGYLIEVHNNNGTYLGHLNSNFHVDYIQKDNQDGEYLYKEEIKH